MLLPLALLLLAAAPEPIDLTRYGVFATVVVPAGGTVESNGDGRVAVFPNKGTIPTWVEISRNPLSAAAVKARLSSIAFTVDRLDPNGDFTLAWNQTQADRRSILHGLDEGRILCQVNGTQVEQYDAVCRSLKVKRVGEIVRVVALEGPSLERSKGSWKLGGLLRAEVDGLPAPKARLSINGTALAPSKQPGVFGIAGVEAKPGEPLLLEYAAAGARGKVLLPCPGELNVRSPEDQSPMSPSMVKWEPAKGAEKASVEVAPYDVGEQVVRPGVVLGWASATDDAMSIMLPTAPPPYLVTVTAYGPEPKELQARLSCRVVVKLVTLPKR
ncbi:MAG: hypothetical protein Q8L48_19865 [Archangium sp.]|nr:hypothetical protein [Archangium sp.]